MLQFALALDLFVVRSSRCSPALLFVSASNSPFTQIRKHRHASHSQTAATCSPCSFFSSHSSRTTSPPFTREKYVATRSAQAIHSIAAPRTHSPTKYVGPCDGASALLTKRSAAVWISPFRLRCRLRGCRTSTP